MALGTNHIRRVDLAKFIIDQVSDEIYQQFYVGLQLARFITDRSDEIAGGGDTIKQRTLPKLVSNTKVFEQQVTLQRPVPTEVSLVVDNWQESSFLVEDREATAVINSEYTMMRYAESAGKSVALAVETAIAAKITDAAVTQSVGTTTNWANDMMGKAMAIYENQGVPVDNLADFAFFLSPSVYWTQVATTDLFLNRNYNPTSNSTGSTFNTQFQIGGINVFRTPLLPKINANAQTVNVLMHKDAIQWAHMTLPRMADNSRVLDLGVRLQSSYKQEYLGTLTTADIVFGVAVIRPELIVKIITNS